MVCTKTASLPELLAPAGSFEHLKTAIKAGADAVYLGGGKFGARAFANNFTKEELIAGIRYAHFYNKKVYLTVNTLMKEREIEEELYDFILPYYEAGLDGVIIQDLGTVAYLREHFPGLELHASTQMTITTTEGAIAAKRMGICRIVPARELSMEEISHIKEKTGLEIEVFIHGALCYCYSGQCLMSSVYGGRSGNRGSCAQPCRLPYTVDDQTAHYLSPKDLCSLYSLPELIESGMDSLKIEGRMKNTDFVAGVVMIYRKYLDYYASLKKKDSYKVDPKDMDILTEIFSRDGFTKGYLHQHNGKNMMSMESPNHLGKQIGKVISCKKNRIQVKLEDMIYAKDILVIPLRNRARDEVILTVPNEMNATKAGKQISLNIPAGYQIHGNMPVYRRKNMNLAKMLDEKVYQRNMDLPVQVKLQIRENQTIALQMFCDGQAISLDGPVPEKALGKPVTKADIIKQFKKTGNVPFILEDIEIILEDGLFLPLSILKSLRQDAYQAMQEKLEDRGARQHIHKEENAWDNSEKAPHLPNSMNYDMMKTHMLVTVYDEAMLSLVLQSGKADGICFPMDFWKAQSLENAYENLMKYNGQIKKYLALPRMIRETDFLSTKRKEVLETALLTQWDGYYIYHINEAQWIKSLMDQGKISKKAELIMASSMYQWNRYAMEEVNRLFGEEHRCIMDTPREFSWQETMEYLDRIGNNNHEVLLYGHFPLMISTQCVNKNARNCTHKADQFTMKDSKGRQLIVTTHCDLCYNMIWTDQPRDWRNDYELAGEKPSRVRIDFFHCNRKKIMEILNKI